MNFELGLLLGGGVLFFFLVFVIVWVLCVDVRESLGLEVSRNIVGGELFWCCFGFFGIVEFLEI